MLHTETKSSPSFAEIASAVRANMADRPSSAFVPGKTPIPLQVPSFGPDEVIEALDSMMTGWVTMGKKVKAFEDAWAQYIGVKHAVMTNSGSSANLLLLSAYGFDQGDEIITPALTWATTVFPIAQVGATPVLVDVERDSYNINPDAIERAITPRTKAVFLVHLLGNPCRMDRIKDTADRHNLILLEDSCEAPGAEYHGQKVGSFGEAATFSFFFSHHISTIEGGMVVTDDDYLADQFRARRAHGWIRDISTKENIARYHPSIDPRFLFAWPGYNFRPTEIQGAFGIHQVPKLEGFIAIRRENHAYWNNELSRYEQYLEIPWEKPGTRHVSLAYPIQVKEGAPFTKQALQDYLESCGVETRPIEAGAMHLQPAMKHINWRAGGPLTNAEHIHHNAFFWGNHQGIGPVEREAVAGYVHDFMKRGE